MSTVTDAARPPAAAAARGRLLFLLLLMSSLLVCSYYSSLMPVSDGGSPPHHFGSPALTGSGGVHPPRTNVPWIYFHFTNKNLYAGSNDVEFIGQALW
jgi:hypothetical protein